VSRSDSIPLDQLYQYYLDPALIAKAPARPRDHSRLLIYDTGSNDIVLDQFYNLPKYLPKNSFLVMNETKVLPARFKAKRENGEEVELLIFPHANEVSELKELKSTANKRLRNGQKIFLTQRHLLEVIEDTEKAFTFKAHFDLAELPALLLKHGETPLPHYIQGNLSEKALRKKYQTVFAKNAGAVAAPTAALHFTNRVFKKLEKAGVPQSRLTLHIGLGTFAPVLPEHLESKTLYEENYEIRPEEVWEIEQAKLDGLKCTAVGTTTVRTLESFARNRKNSGQTNLFIFPPFEFQMVDQLLTNFHLPESSLMMLVEAFLQHKGAKRHLKELYAFAIKEQFRFYSFGDSMLIV